MTLSLAWENKEKPTIDECELIPREAFPEAVTHTLSILESFRALEQNWDGYGARKPSLNAMMGAAAWISLLCDADTPVPSVFPVPNGNVQIEWSLQDVELEIEVISQSTCEAYFEDRRQGHEAEWEKLFTYDLHELRKAVNTIAIRSNEACWLAVVQ